MADRNKPTSLYEWQKLFADIYGPQNRWRDTPTIWLRVVEATGELARVIRNDRNLRVQIPPAIPPTLEWIFALANRIGFRLDEVTWDKYPAACPYCFDSSSQTAVQINKREVIVRPCRCTKARKSRSYSGDIKNSAEFVLLRETGIRPESLADWQRMFAAIYGAQHGSALNDLAFHFIEEVGEVALELRYERLDQCVDEVADMFSWILSIANAAEEKIGSQVRVERALWEAYPGVCRKCGKNPCVARPQGHNRASSILRD